MCEEFLFVLLLSLHCFGQSDPSQDVAKLALSLLVQETEAHPDFLDIKLGNGVVRGFIHWQKMMVGFLLPPFIKRVACALWCMPLPCCCNIKSNMLPLARVSAGSGRRSHCRNQ